MDIIDLNGVVCGVLNTNPVYYAGNMLISALTEIPSTMLSGSLSGINNNLSGLPSSDFQNQFISGSINIPSGINQPQKQTFKEKRLAEIQSQIEYCSALMMALPDADVETRVRTLDENPCITGTYYLNAIYNENQVVSSEIEAQKEIVEVQKLVRYDESNYKYSNTELVEMLSGLESDDNIGLGFVLKNNGLGTLDEIVFNSFSLKELTNYVESYSKNSSVNAAETDPEALLSDFNSDGLAIYIVTDVLLDYHAESVLKESNPLTAGRSESIMKKRKPNM